MSLKKINTACGSRDKKHEATMMIIIILERLFRKDISISLRISGVHSEEYILLDCRL